MIKLKFTWHLPDMKFTWVYTPNTPMAYEEAIRVSRVFYDVVVVVNHDDLM
jgi:hypothetical protein